MQRYKCASCKRVFKGGHRLNSEKLWIEFTSGKQTYAQLALKYNCSTKTVQRRLDNFKLSKNGDFPAIINLLMDTTYFGRQFGVMVFKDSISGQVLYKQYVKQETNNLYLKGVEKITIRGIKIQAIICDGRKGLIPLFSSFVPVQLCVFHQVAIIRRYLTKKPKMQASKELWELVLLLKQTDKESFIGGLQEWHTKWEDFLNEKRVDENGKKRFVHKNLRAAYRSLKTNLPYLFTWYDFKELNIPNTTNAIDGVFADLKNKLRNHNGLSKARKQKFVDEFFKV